MKKLLLIGTLMCLAQIAFSQTRFGVRGGLNIANEKIKATVQGQTFSEHLDAIPTFHIGGMADIPLSEFFSIQPSLLFEGKGANGDDGTGEKAKIRPYYIEIPILLVGRTTLPNTKLKAFVGVGPSFGYGLFGKATSSQGSPDIFGSDGFKRFDFGVNMALGVELPAGYQFSFHFIPGVANIGPDNDPAATGIDDFSLKNSLVQFSIGYFFAGGSTK